MTLLAINWNNIILVTLVGFGVVFCILVLLIAVITLFGKVMAPKAKVTKTTTTTGAGNATVKVEQTEEGHIPALDSAAIATALHMYFDEVHDEESLVVTIKTVERRYSPWNSKIYGLNNNFTR
ncbi:MAG: OadG family protein [Paludibacteraceae bacterium]|jgi:sodium pump decarboxylase gamma subunit|nr:OadG family protein [Paludibacteraceae bacterium]